MNENYKTKVKETAQLYNSTLVNKVVFIGVWVNNPYTETRYTTIGQLSKWVTDGGSQVSY